jgi:hypothetical protein
MDLQKLKENCVGLSISIQEHRLYQAFYEQNRDKYGGFPGIWHKIGDIAQWLTEVEEEIGETCWNEKDWITTLDEIAEMFFEQHGDSEQVWKEDIRFTIENPT